MWDRVYWALFGNNVRTVRTIFLSVAVVHFLYFLVLPWLLTRRKASKSPRLRRYLQFVVATPSLLGDLMRAPARHDLMRLAHVEGLHELAAEQGFAIVRHKGLPGTFLAEVRTRLANDLESLGRDEEAAEQRRLGAGDLEAGGRKTGRDAAWHINRARQLAAARDYSGCQVRDDGLEEGLDVATRGPE